MSACRPSPTANIRRSFWHFDFYGMLDSVSVEKSDHGIQFQGIQTQMKVLKGHRQDRFSPNHPMMEHFKFVKAHTKQTPKMCIPSPTVMHFRLEPGAVASHCLS